MIYDQQLADFLAETKVVATRASDLSAIGERGENSPITKPVGSQLCLEV